MVAGHHPARPRGACRSLRSEVAAGDRARARSRGCRVGTPTPSRPECRGGSSAARRRWDSDATHGRRVPDTPVPAWVCDRLVPALRRHHRRDRRGARARWTGGSSRPGRAGPRPGGWPTCCRPAATSTPSTPRPCPPAWPGRSGARWPTGCSSATCEEEGRYPASVGLVVWGTSAMRTGGDDVAEALALLGVRPVWAEGSGRVEGLELIDAAELGRPRVDVTLRVSGFFRDAFPHVLRSARRAVRAGRGCRATDGRTRWLVRARRAPRLRPKPGCLRVGHPRPARVGGLAGRRPTSPRSTWPGAAGPTGAGGAAGRPRRRSPAGSPRSRSRSRTRTTGSTTSSTPTTTCRTTAGWWRRSGPSRAVQPKAWFGDSADPARPRVR